MIDRPPAGEDRARTDDRAAVLWMDALETLAVRAGHELRNALNGIAVNLEVVRSRSERAGSTGEQVVSFARAAASQLEGAIAIVEAWLRLGRPPRSPADIGGVLADAAMLLRAEPTASPPPVVEIPAAGEWLTTADPQAARLVLVRLAIDGLTGGAFRASAGSEGGRIRVEVRGVTPSGDTVEAMEMARAAGIAVTRGDDGSATLTFPGPARA